MAEADKEKIPAAFMISRQLDQEKINFLTKRIQDLLKSNNELRSGVSQNEKDTHDIVLYFQREMEIKDDIILRLNEELVKCQTQLKFEVEKARKQFEQELAEVKATSEYTIATLTMKLKDAEGDLKAVEVYKREKDQHEEIIKRLELSMKQQREQLIDAMEEQERRFLEEKALIYKDLDDQKSAFREVALNEARSAMGEEAKKILADNTRMFEELKFHHSEAAHFQSEKSKLILDLSTTRREVSLLAEKEIEYAKQNHNRAKEIKALRDRVEQLEKQQAMNIEKFKIRAKELKLTVKKELEQATMDAAGLRRLLQIKNKELRHMKSLAATILSQRTETEQFFLEALEEVKVVIRQEKKTKFVTPPIHSNTMNNTNNTSGKNNNNNTFNGTFPPLNVKPANLHLLENRKKTLDVSLQDLQKVTITDLSWEDKELVLRVLFAKINALSVQNNARTSHAQSNGGLGPKKQHNNAVFISEGANILPNNQDNQYLQPFEISSSDKYGGGGGGEFDLDGEEGQYGGDGEEVTFEDDLDDQPHDHFDENGVYKPSAALERMLQNVNDEEFQQ